MDPVRNPYSPGAGTPPPELAGRDKLREQVRVAIARIRRGNTAKSVLNGGIARSRQDRAPRPDEV